MRQLTAYASYLDNLGAPLVGRARFYNMDGSEAVVYSLDNATEAYEEIGAMVFTNSSGQLEPQVFLADHDYLVVFDKYVGHARMTEDTDAESWDEQGSAVDRYNTLGITLEGNSVRCVATMADLRKTVAVEGDNPEVVLLLGYYESGDKEPVYYQWNSTSVASPDGGSVVKVTSPMTDLGRWEMVGCPRYLDVRHFGAFPLQGVEEDGQQNYAIGLANDYAHANGCGLYFDATPTAAYYGISGLTLYDVDSNPDARLFAKTGEAASINGIVSVHLATYTGFTGRIDLVDDEVRTSWSEESVYGRFMPTYKLVVDSSIDYGAAVEFQDLRVDILANPGDNVAFNNCSISSIGAITGLLTLKNCELKTEWFVDNYDWDDLVLQGNTILLKNCKDADTYILLKNKQSEVDYGDLGEQEVHDAAFGAGALVENCRGNATLAGDAELHNVNLTLDSVEVNASLNCVDSWLTFDSVPQLVDLSVRRGSITGTNSTIVDGALRLESVTVACPLWVNGGTPTLFDCDITEDITQVAKVDGAYHYIDGQMSCCRLFARHVLKTLSSPGYTRVRFIWKNNHGNVSSPIDLTDIASKVENAAQGYVYVDNTGLFVPTRAVQMATSFTATAPGGHGWVATPNFNAQDVSLFVIGSRVVRSANHFVTGYANLGKEEGTATLFVTTTTGTLSPSDYGTNILMAPLNDGTNDMYDVADGGYGTFWADLEVL